MKYYNLSSDVLREEIVNVREGLILKLLFRAVRTVIGTEEGIKLTA